MTIAYLVNQYPKVSHSFIRREIAGLEACGLQVARFALRSCGSELVDEADKLELEKTRIVLGVGIAGLLVNLLNTALTRPVAWLKVGHKTHTRPFWDEFDHGGDVVSRPGRANLQLYRTRPGRVRRAKSAIFRRKDRASGFCGGGKLFWQKPAVKVVRSLRLVKNPRRSLWCI